MHLTMAKRHARTPDLNTSIDSMVRKSPKQKSDMQSSSFDYENGDDSLDRSIEELNTTQEAM